MERQTEVLVLGGGLSGKLAAYYCIKKGLNVTLVSPTSLNGAPRYCNESEVLLKDANSFVSNSQMYSRSVDHLLRTYPSAVAELFNCNDLNLSDHPTLSSLSIKLREFLLKCDGCEILSAYYGVELITLECASSRASDRYRKSTCIGAYLQREGTEELIPCIAKEVILATGGVVGLSSKCSLNVGSGLAMASRIGARVMNLDAFNTSATYLRSPTGVMVELPIEVAQAGILRDKLGNTVSSINAENSPHTLELDDEKWAILESMNPSFFESAKSWGCKFSGTIGLDRSISFMRGGVVVDKSSQTVIQRLRAVGELSCTGLQTEATTSCGTAMDTVTWAYSAAYEIHKQVSRFAYYSPKILPRPTHAGPKKQIDLSKSLNELRYLMSEHFATCANEEDLRHLSYRLACLEAEWELKKHTLQPNSSAWHYIHALKTCVQLISHHSRSSMRERFSDAACVQEMESVSIEGA